MIQDMLIVSLYDAMQTISLDETTIKYYAS